MGKKMIPRIVRIGLEAKYAITGRKKQLRKFEDVLKDAGYEGTISNEAARVLNDLKAQGIKPPKLNWIILYHHTHTDEKIYAYRTEAGITAKRKVEIVSISKMKKILNNS